MPLQPFPDPDTYKIIGAAMAVHTELGCGFLEAVYKAALAIEFERAGVSFVPEVLLPISYKDRPLPLRYRVDFVCCGDVIVETKALDAITTRDEAQLLNYMKAAGGPARPAAELWDDESATRAPGAELVEARGAGVAWRSPARARRVTADFRETAGQ